MATIRDIAKRANVSIATVSRVLNNAPTVGESIRYSVLRAAEELDYPIDNLRLKPQINPAILVLVRPNDTQSNPTTPTDRDFERMVWDGVHRVFDQRNMAARLQQALSSAQEAETFAKDPAVSGLILLGGIIQPAFVEVLLKHKVPFVVAGSHLHPFQINAVMADVIQGARDAVAHLIAQGRRQIALVNGPSSTMTSVEKREGFQLALAQQGLSWRDEQHIVTSDFSAEGGFVQTQKLLSQFPQVDAILYADDTIALGGLRALREAGRRIPQDVAVIGFGDYPLAQYSHPLLSSVRFDMRQMGTIAAKRLCMLLDEPDEDAWLVRVPCELVVRQSSTEGA